ncbi:MAG: glutamate mutase L [Anaerolineae bacterium]
MSDGRRGESYLLIDVGHVLTHVAHLALVDGEARLVAVAEAATTSGAEGGLLDGVRRAVANLEMLAGHRLLGAEGELRRPADDGSGVDGAILTASLAPALRVAVVGIAQELSLASALRAATVPFASVVRTVCLEASERRWRAEDVEALLAAAPDVIVVVGGVDGGPLSPLRDLGEVLSTAYSVLPESDRPTIVYAGNERAQRMLVAAFAGITELRLVANVRPSADVENLGELRAALSRLFYRNRLGQTEDLRQLAAWAGASPLYDLDALARTLRFLARRHGLTGGILGVDIGGNGSRALRIEPQGPALTWGAPYGTGAALAALRSLDDPRAVLRWLKTDLSWAEVWDRLSNVEVRPAGVPQTEEDWDLQQAAAREALSRSWQQAAAGWRVCGAESFVGGDMIVARGSVLNHARSPGQAALVLMDALEPAGLLRLTLDWANLLPGLAGLAQIDALAAVQVLDNDALLELGTLVAPRGNVRQGREALQVRMMVQGETRTELTVPGGCIRRLPLGVNERARLELYPAQGMALGVGHGGEALVADVRGGELGVIIDARGRPLRLPTDDGERRAILERWSQEID